MVRAAWRCSPQSAVTYPLLTGAVSPCRSSGPVTRITKNSLLRTMGFNRRKLEDQRRETADHEAASRRATDAQVLEDAPNRSLERASVKANADDVLSNHGRCHQDGLLVLVGALPGLPNDECDRPSPPGPSSRRGGKQSHSRTFVQIVSAERTVRRASAAVSRQHR
jgi:hypothetical protein